MPAPFLSLLIDDCIARGKDYHDGGARYNTSYIQGVGMGTITDMLSALRYHVFDQKDHQHGRSCSRCSEADFAGYERQRQLLLNKTPKYGNDDDYADGMMRRVFEAYFNAIDGRKNTRGGEYHINLLPTTCHIYFGSVTGATPDGRKAWTPLSEGISPVQGADRHGPTAVLKSAAKMDHARTGGTLLNQKFTPQLLADETGLEALVQLVRDLLPAGRAPHPVQRGGRRHAARGAEAPRAAPRPDRARGRLQRLLLRPERGAAGRDHRPHRTPIILAFLPRRTLRGTKKTKRFLTRKARMRRIPCGYDVTRMILFSRHSLFFSVTRVENGSRPAGDEQGDADQDPAEDEEGG